MAKSKAVTAPCMTIGTSDYIDMMDQLGEAATVLTLVAAAAESVTTDGRLKDALQHGHDDALKRIEAVIRAMEAVLEDVGVYDEPSPTDVLRMSGRHVQKANL